MYAVALYAAYAAGYVVLGALWSIAMARTVHEKIKISADHRETCNGHKENWVCGTRWFFVYDPPLKHGGPQQIRKESSFRQAMIFHVFGWPFSLIVNGSSRLMDVLVSAAKTPIKIDEARAERKKAALKLTKANLKEEKFSLLSTLRNKDMPDDFTRDALKKRCAEIEEELKAVSE